ncbi:ribosomal protein S18-alanine N-acetyltransferase [Cytobacillus sp. S13-E01]|uniref:ribosomal protein S18-alanine N-acetyltransferase n=1 Tax=Cytobacillus sp. S13-E01 TaxID=3031326 RepID=UPI0023D7CFEC|nr:ribosomal protein S18-alanine N-acetyltransferase [Cytobacillus sp. S13-E01]MDF0728723.1 ribosomal protein S18-alanine N-acetyltransferase [Cytobacillus sp. S13-E01]
MRLNIAFRPMTIHDIEQILVIENSSFATPWSREAFYNEIVYNQFANYIVMLDGVKVIGYCGMWHVIDETHITNIAVLPEYRGKKLGEALLLKAMEVSKRLGAVSMTLEVRVSNVVAQALYKKLGFQPGGIRKRYYTDNLEDALVMWVNVNENR